MNLTASQLAPQLDELTDKVLSVYRPWKLDRERLVLRHDERGYEVDLEDCARSSAAMMDWIFQVARKSWATDKCVASLIHALNDLLQPQRYLCSRGKERGPFNLTQAYIDERIDSFVACFLHLQLKPEKEPESSGAFGE
jgi:hypothetical protein